MNKFLDKTFKLSANNTTVKTEIAAGVTTFFAMCYIIFVNPNFITGTNSGALWNAVFVGSILAAIIGTLLMAFVAKLPFAQAAGMGLNSFFFVSFILPALTSGGDVIESYGAGLAIILVSGAVFMILSVTGLREYIAKSLPVCLKKSIPAGIGLFIAFIGLKNAGLVIADRYTFVSIANFTNLSTAAPAIAALLGIIIIAVLWKLRVKGSVVIGIIATAVLVYLFKGVMPDFSSIVGVSAFKDFFEIGFFNLRFDIAFNGVSFGGIISVIMLVITFMLVDMFDTIGTLYGTAAQAGMLDEKGDPIRVNKAMLCDSIATVAGACLGTSTVTTYVESAAGVSEGGRTGLTSVVVSILFFIALFFSPFASLIPSEATAPALIFVGVLMMKSFKDVDLEDVSSAVPAFLTLVLMPLTYSIANGIAIGVISYVLIKLLTGKVKEINLVLVILALLFIAKFALVFMGTVPAYAF